LLDKLVSDIVKIFTGHANGLDALDQWWKDQSGLLGLLTQPDQLLATLQGLLNTVWTLLTGVVNHPDKTLADVVDALTLWFTNTFDALTNLVTNLGTNFQLFLDGLGSIFGLTGAGKTVAEAVQAISDWLTTVFKPVVDGLADVVKTVTDLINGFFKLFGGTGTVNLGAMLTAATAWMTNWQKFVDGIWNAFTGGVAGAGKTVTDALKAVTDWLSTVWQKLVDGITTIWKPGLIVSGAHAGVQDVIDAITGILGVGQSAAEAANHANITLAAAAAAAKSGHSDEFDYPKSGALPPPWWIHTGANKWGPNGSGVLVYKGAKFADGAASEMYVQTADPLPGVTATVTVVLSRPPDVNNLNLTQNYVYICVQCSATDKSCIRWRIGEEKAQLQTVNAAGAATNVGAAQTLPTLHSGDVLAMETTATDATLRINNIVQATRPYTPLAGRNIGFGLEVSAYFGHIPAPGHPAAELAGIAWHP
jgi:predicted RNase H-like HicB family nuclease